jgi:NDP-sugar pyrophosphorylase family protein
VTAEIVVMAAGEGTRLRPVTERWAKPVLPIDGRPVLATLLREIADAGCPRVWLVTGHLAGQVEALAGDGAGFGVEIEIVRQPVANGSADAVRLALAAGARPPLLLAAADTVYSPGALALFGAAYEASGAEGAIAVRRMPGRPPNTRVVVADDRVVRLPAPDADTDLTAAPLWAFGEVIAAEIERVCEPPFEPPFEVAAAFQAAIDAGRHVLSHETGPTRDLTNPLDLVEENFSYLRGLV